MNRTEVCTRWLVYVYAGCPSLSFKLSLGSSLLVSHHRLCTYARSDNKRFYRYPKIDIFIVFALWGWARSCFFFNSTAVSKNHSVRKTVCRHYSSQNRNRWQTFLLLSKNRRFYCICTVMLSPGHVSFSTAQLCLRTTQSERPYEVITASKSEIDGRTEI